MFCQSKNDVVRRFFFVDIGRVLVQAKTRAIDDVFDPKYHQGDESKAVRLKRRFLGGTGKLKNMINPEVMVKNGQISYGSKISTFPPGEEDQVSHCYRPRQERFPGRDIGVNLPDATYIHWVSLDSPLHCRASYI